MTINPSIYTNWTMKELLSARAELQRDYWGSDRSWRTIIERQLVDIDAELVARNLAQMDARQ